MATRAPVTPRRRLRGGTFFEWASLLTGFASVVLAVVAVVYAHSAWTRPYPADPTQVPTWGTGGQPRLIAGPSDALAFFDFLEDNAGRKVRVNAMLDSDYYSGVDEESYFAPGQAGFVSPSEDCGDVPLPDLEDHYFHDGTSEPGCEFIAELRVQDVGPDRPGMFWLHGAWYLKGYFASEGFVDFHMGVRSYAVTPLTTIEAIN